MSTIPDALKQKLEKIRQDYAPRIQKLQQRGDKMKDDFNEPDAFEATIGIDFDISWQDVKISFDMPSLTVKDQNLSFDVPDVTMEEQRWSFDIPSTCFHRVVIAPGVEINVPYPCMKTQEIIFHLPSITMKRIDIVVGIPEFSSERVEWIVGLPQFTIHNVSVELTDAEQQGKQLESDANKLADDMKKDIAKAIADYLNAGSTEVNNASNEIKNKFDAAITRVRSAINEIRNANGDPTSVPDGKGGKIDLRKLLDDLNQQKVEALDSFAALLNQLG